MTTSVTIETQLNAGTPTACTIEVGELALSHVLRSFNVTNDRNVDATKVLCAALIQQMLDLREVETPQDTTAQLHARIRATERAIEMIEQAQMQAVKAYFAQA